MGASEKLAAAFHGSDLSDRASPVVQAGLARYCKICHRAPGFDCTSITDGGPLPGRIIHIERATRKTTP